MCILIGLTSPLILPLLEPAIGILTGWPVETLQTPLSQASSSLAMISAFGVASGLGSSSCAISTAILKRRPVDSSVTWDCGYAAPAARMQYTAISFAGPLTTVFGLLLQSRSSPAAPIRPVCPAGSVETHTPDLFQRFFYTPIFTALSWISRAVRWLQHGRVHLYILYIVLTLLVLLSVESGMISILSSILTVLLGFALAPLLLGVVNRTKAVFAGRRASRCCNCISI